MLTTMSLWKGIIRKDSGKYLNSTGIFSATNSDYFNVRTAEHSCGTLKVNAFGMILMVKFKVVYINSPDYS